MKDYGISQSLKNLGIESVNPGISTGSTWTNSTSTLASVSPVDGQTIAEVRVADQSNYDQIVEVAQQAFVQWRAVPAPKRGEIVRQLGNALRDKKSDLGKLVSYEMGKSLQEGLGEVQEMIDICDFAVGISRQLYGQSMHSERLEHRMYEQYHPLGVVGIISAFNFPVAVWSWNAALAWVCGDVCIWKPSEKAPLSAIACQKIVADVFTKNDIPEGVSCLLIGDAQIGSLMAKDKRIPLVSATGSTRMGRSVGETVGARLGRALLELGGNNAIILSEKADLSMALIGIVFGAVGTCGQRCTSTRRLIVHESILEQVKTSLKSAYSQLRIGNPLDENNHVGPLIDRQAVQAYLNATAELKKLGAKEVIAGEVLDGPEYQSGCYVKPAIYQVENHFDIVQSETFAPILYIIPYSDIQEAIAIQNDVPQGLSSAIMTRDVRESELFLSHAGSDCGIANVNIGTSGAEIGGAFGGEKETGGGRESGSDAWKVYMRRQTNTINYGNSLPLAQGIRFEL